MEGFKFGAPQEKQKESPLSKEAAQEFADMMRITLEGKGITEPTAEQYQEAFEKIEDIINAANTDVSDDELELRIGKVLHTAGRVALMPLFLVEMFMLQFVPADSKDETDYDRSLMGLLDTEAKHKLARVARRIDFVSRQRETLAELQARAQNRVDA